MIKSLSNFFVKLVHKYLPNPFLFAILLTFLVFVMGMTIGDASFMGMVTHWYGGFWNLLTFSMQMALILVTGHALANSPLFQKVLAKIAQKAETPTRAVIITSIVALVASWINWGFGLIIGALLAKEMAKKVKGLHYPLIIATGYISFIVWHAGLSGSAPLSVNTAGHFMEDAIGLVPTSSTLFAPYNLIILGVLAVALPLITKAMMPGEGEEIIEIDPEILEAEEEAAATTTADKEDMTPAEKIENSRIIAIVLGVLGLIYVVKYFATNGFALNLNIVNFTFLFLGIILHGTPIRYVNAVIEAVKGAGGIILQFPFYAGIMGMMTGSGLAVIMSNWFVSISNQTTLPFFSFLSAGIVNVFVPSGGGQWAVQAPIFVPAAKSLGVATDKIVMSVAWGDALTNLVQPFWALPALGIAGLDARDIMGYCVTAMVIAFVIIGLGLVVL